MFQLRLMITGLLCLMSMGVFADITAEKQSALDKLRSDYARSPFRSHDNWAEPLEKCRELLQPDGRFSDLVEAEEAIRKEKWVKSPYSEPQGKVGAVIEKGYYRLWRLSEPFRRGKKDDALKTLIFKSVLHYGQIETERVNVPCRFHGSCFAIPTSAINIYFCFFPEMDSVEKKTNHDSLTQSVNEMLRKVGYQTWTVPARNDETDSHIVSVDRFRKHVWWVGGNALAYRSVLPAAIMMNSIPMVDVLAKVARGAMSVVGQNNYDDAFWIEGFTADGAGWGHGMQALVWGYPIHGANSALGILQSLKGTPWATTLGRQETESLLNFFRGSSFYFYKGHIPPFVSRSNMVYSGYRKHSIPNLDLARSVLQNWNMSLSDTEKQELTTFVNEAKAGDAFMDSAPAGFYHGSRYFFNNDDMIHKSRDFYLCVNMASRRTDGLESAAPGAAGYNFFIADGATQFARNGDEYLRGMGATNLTSWPGVTTRQTPLELHPIINWRGYCSTFNFAGGATSGSDFAAGFIYQKLNASSKANVNDLIGLQDKNNTIFGVLAYKSYFFFGKTFLALGAGITNEKPEYEGTITTTLEQCPDINGKTIGKWELNNGFAYQVLDHYTTGKTAVKREKRMTDWKKLSPKANADVKEYEIAMFQMTIDHGREVDGGTYAYVVQTDGNTNAKLPIVLSNTTQLQAAESADSQSIGAVFFDPKTVLKCKLGNFKVSAPCVMLLETVKDGYLLSVSDAEMNPKLSVLNIQTPWGEKQIQLPQGALSGSAVSIKIQK